MYHADTSSVNATERPQFHIITSAVEFRLYDDHCSSVIFG